MFVINSSTYLVLQKIGEYDLIFVISRYYDTEKLRGGEKFAKRFYEFYPNNFTKAIFIDFFRGYSAKKLFLKIFGNSEIIKNDNKVFLKLGIINIYRCLLKYPPQQIYLTTLEGYSIFFFLFKIFYPKISVINIVHSPFNLDLSFERKRLPILGRIKIGITEKIIYKYSTFIVFPSVLALQLSRKYFNIDDEKVRIIPHGADKRFFLRGQKINKYHKLRLIYVGGTSRIVKGYEYLFNALSKVDFEISLNICGDIDCNEDFFNQYNNLPKVIEKRILGKKSSFELCEIFTQNDVFVLPSISETFGISALEAMASGLSVIVTTETGISEIIDNGINGFVVEYGNIDEFVSILDKLNTDRDLLEKISPQAVDTASKLKWENLIPKYLEISNCE